MDESSCESPELFNHHTLADRQVSPIDKSRLGMRSNNLKPTRLVRKKVAKGHLSVSTATVPK